MGASVSPCLAVEYVELRRTIMERLRDPAARGAGGAGGAGKACPIMLATS